MLAGVVIRSPVAEAVAGRSEENARQYEHPGELGLDKPPALQARAPRGRMSGPPFVVGILRYRPPIDNPPAENFYTAPITGSYFERKQI